VWPLEVVSKPFISTRATNQAMYYTEAWMETTDWLRNETPEPSLPVNEIVPEEARGENGFVYPEDTYGVMTAWDYGNLVAQRGRRIPVWSRYPAAPPAQWMTSTSEAESLELLCPDCDEAERVRYVIVDSKMAGPLFLTKARVAGKDVGAYGISDGGWNIRGQDVTRRLYGPLYDNSITARLYNRNGEGLSHYRLVFESSEESFLTYQTETTTRIEQYPIRDAEQKAQFEDFVRRGVVASPQGIVHDGWITSTVKIFEVVKGSVIAGTEQPGSEIRAELLLESEASARQIPYTATALVGPGGTFEIRVPYATSRGPFTQITPKGPYRLYRIVEADTTLIGTVDISDAQINDGATVWLAR
jgi:dolichyl-diphosphooligosaccharide--protein glycosyltransferase